MPGLSLSLLLSLAAASAPASTPHISDATKLARTEYEWFHAHPELSKEEVKTAKHLADVLRALGLEVHEGIGGTGIVAVLKGGKGPGPTVLYRADMDGLPVTEATGLAYASQTKGVMHALSLIHI